MLGMPTILDFKSVEENIQFAKLHGFEFIELNLNLKYVRDFILSKRKPDKSLKYTMHFFDEADFGLYEEVSDAYIKLLKRYLKYSHSYILELNLHLNLGPIQTISGVKHYLYKEEFNDYIKRVKKALFKIKKICDKYKITLVLENIKSLDFIMDTYPYLISDFKFCYDIGHDMTSTKMLEPYFYSHLEAFNEVHFHDSTSDLCHLAFGKGDLDIKAIYERIKEIPYILIEVKNKEDLIQSITYLK